MKFSRSSWKMPVVCGAAIVAVLRFGAPTIIPAAPSPAPSATPAAAATPKDSPAPDYEAAVAKLKTADALYGYIDKNATTNDIQPDDALPHDEQVAQVRKLVDQKIALLQPAIATFLKLYPQDPRRWDVQLQRVFFLKDAENISDEDSVNTLKTVAAAPDASNNARHHARAALLQNDLEEVDPNKGLTDDLVKELAAYEKDFPEDESGRDLVRLRMRLLAGTPDKINPILEGLTKSPNKFTAEAAGNQLALRTKAVDWKFDSAVDGKAVDLAKLRGKVVLLDFWATWCAPCMEKIPEIVALKQKYQDKEFQVVGVSFDQDKSALLKVVKAKNMDWPEYFDGKGMEESEMAVRFNIDGIPDAWLVDRQGFLHPVDREADLDEQVSKLVAEKP